MTERESPGCDTSIVNDMPQGAINELLSVARKEPIRIVAKPKTGLDVMHALDAFDSEFLLGEVLATVCEVELRGQRCFAMVIGDDPERALARACADVILDVGDDLSRRQIRHLLKREADGLKHKREQERRLIAATKVNFDLMAGQ